MGDISLFPEGLRKTLAVSGLPCLHTAFRFQMYSPSLFLAQLLYHKPPIFSTQELELATSDNSSFTLNLCLAYTARDEITSSVREIARGVESGE